MAVHDFLESEGQGGGGWGSVCVCLGGEGAVLTDNKMKIIPP